MQHLVSLLTFWACTECFHTNTDDIQLLALSHVVKQQALNSCSTVGWHNSCLSEKQARIRSNNFGSPSIKLGASVLFHLIHGMKYCCIVHESGFSRVWHGGRVQSWCSWLDASNDSLWKVIHPNNHLKHNYIYFSHKLAPLRGKLLKHKSTNNTNGIIIMCVCAPTGMLDLMLAYVLYVLEK